jgi:hypothetical protein
MMSMTTNPTRRRCTWAVIKRWGMVQPRMLHATDMPPPTPSPSRKQTKLVLM